MANNNEEKKDNVEQASNIIENEVTLPIREILATEFLKNQKEAFERDSHLMPLANHEEHNQDVDYWTLLLEMPLRSPDKFANTRALDFGCGCGRNLLNLALLAPFAGVDGVDISPSNVAYAQKWIRQRIPDHNQSRVWETDGNNLGPGVEDGTYSFIMSHVVFQHIGNYHVRRSILKDMYRALEPGGMISIHFLDLIEKSVGYYQNSYVGNVNCRVGNPMFIYRDLEDIGFKFISIKTRFDKDTGFPCYFVKAYKEKSHIL